MYLIMYKNTQHNEFLIYLDFNNLIDLLVKYAILKVELYFHISQVYL